MNSEQESQIIEVSLLKWISLLCKRSIGSLQQLSSGELYIKLMSQVRQFKFMRPLKNIEQNSEQSLNLVNRISNMKIIGDSILRHYQTYLMRDISGMKIDYVQLCMGNRSEGIKLFSLVIGVIGQSEDSEGCKKLIEAISHLQPEDQDIARALLENSRCIGQSIVKREDSPLRKKMLTKLQTYEDRIQTLQLELSAITQELQEEKLTNQSLIVEIKQLRTQKSKLIQKIQVLQLLNSRLQSQNSSYILQNDNLVKKLQSQRRHSDSILAKHQQTFISYQKQLSVMQLLKQKTQQLKSVNTELKQLLSETLRQQHDRQGAFNLMKQNYRVLSDRYIETKERLGQVEMEFENFKLSRDKSQWKMWGGSGYRVGDESQLSSVKYRVKERLGSVIKGELSQVQMVDSNVVVRKQSADRTINSNTQKNLVSSHLQNFSHFAYNSMTKNCNLQDIQDVSEFEPNTTNEQQLDKSILIDQNDKYELKISQQQSKLRQKFKQEKQEANQQLQQPNIDEQNLMIGLFADLYSQNQRLRSQLENYKDFAIKKQHRHQIFKQKLSKIRQIETISQISLKFQAQKQNISQNGSPFTLMTEKSSQNQKKIPKNSPQSSSQNYPYYPLVLN